MSGSGPSNGRKSQNPFLIQEGREGQAGGGGWGRPSMPCLYSVHERPDVLLSVLRWKGCGGIEDLPPFLHNRLLSPTELEDHYSSSSSLTSYPIYRLAISTVLGGYSRVGAGSLKASVKITLGNNSNNNDDNTATMMMMAGGDHPDLLEIESLRRVRPYKVSGLNGWMDGWMDGWFHLMTTTTIGS